MMKRFHFFAKAVVFLLSLTPSFSVAQTTAYEQLTSIADIDENARYVLGLEGTGFHYSGTSSWGLVALPSVQSPIHYILTKAADASCFTAKATISGTEYYLQIAWSSQSNTFSMGTTPNPSYDYNSLVIGTTCSGTPTPNYGVAHKEWQSYHLRIYENNEHVPGLRTYHNTTGTMAYFYKEVTVVSTETELRAALDAYIHNIRLANNITLSNHISIYGGYTVTIDLDGHTLNRGLTEATYNGDVIEVYETASLTMMNGTLTGGYNNRTDEYSPGCIYNNGTVTLTDVTITGCKGDDGGAIRNQEGAVLAITGGAITGCESLNHGGGAIVNYGTANISNCSLNGNTASTRGGAIWSNSTLTMSGCTINGNEALDSGGSGGGLHIEGDTVTLTDVTITNNTSKDAGGIYIKAGTTLKLGGTTGSTISGNKSSEHGGGGITNHGTLSLTGTVSITGNTCHTNGGGIWNNGTLNMQGDVHVYDNNCDDIFLKTGKVINVTGALTSGAESIGIRNEDIRHVFTNGYASSNTVIMPFFPGGTINTISVADGECRQNLSYYECSWNSTTNTIEKTIMTVPEAQAISNICTSQYASGGDLWGDSYWFFANGVGEAANGLTCRGSDVHLILMDNAQMTCTKGLKVPQGTRLHIYTQSYGNNMGKLFATGTDEDAAAIGGEDGVRVGEIIIHGGEITAVGGEYTAGIGGGGYHGSFALSDDRTNDGGTLTVFGGIIRAYGGILGAGIGGGVGGNGAVFTLYGGEVYAYGGNSFDGGRGSGAGIGSGDGRLSTQNGSTFTVYGGYVEAHGGDGSAGIGGGYNASGGTVNIHGGTVMAYGEKGGAGIGSGILQDNEYYDDIVNYNDDPNWETIYSYTNGGTVLIDGGHVEAWGSRYTGDGNSYISAGIGGGYDSYGGNVTINGGTVLVVARAGDGYFAIGDGISEDDAHIGSLSIGDRLMVHYGNMDTSITTASNFWERVTDCQNFKCVRIEPCDHNGATFNIADGLKHRFNCNYCNLTTEAHTFGTYGECDACHLVSLADRSDNSSVISHWNGEKMSMVLTDRTLYKDGLWNTLCLPFDVTLSGSALDGAIARPLNEAYISGTTLNLTFGDPVNTLLAGTPYIIKWAKANDYVDDDAHNIVNPMFNGVTVSTDKHDYDTDEESVTTDERVRFVGTYKSTTFDSEDTSILLMGAENTLYYPTTGAGIGAQRAYFKIGGVNQAMLARRLTSFSIDFAENDNTTSIIGISSETRNNAEGWYSLDGRKLAGKPTQSGIYINNGKKVVIK